jgi:hypothetical protein
MNWLRAKSVECPLAKALEQAGAANRICERAALSAAPAALMQAEPRCRSGYGRPRRTYCWFSRAARVSQEPRSHFGTEQSSVFAVQEPGEVVRFAGFL